MKRLIIFSALLPVAFQLYAQSNMSFEVNDLFAVETRSHLMIGSEIRGNQAFNEKRWYRSGESDSVNAVFVEALLHVYLLSAPTGFFAGDADSLLATYTLWELLNKSAKTYFASADEYICPKPAKTVICETARKIELLCGFGLRENLI